MTDKPELPDGHSSINDARHHTTRQGDGSVAAIPPQNAPPKPMQRRILVRARAPFLPDHHAHHGRRGLKGS